MGILTYNSMDKVLFLINDGVYPFRTGGMEIFNYHLIKELSQNLSVSYIANNKYDFDAAKFIKSISLRPRKFFIPLQTFIYLLIKREYNHIVISFSDAHWLVWKMYAMMIKILRIKSTVIIHYGKDVPRNHKEVYVSLFNSATNVIAVSDDIKRNYDSAFGLDCKVVYPLIPFTLSLKSKESLRLKYNLPIDANIITMVGSLKTMKNPNRVLEALMLFDEDDLLKYNPCVVFAGDGAMRGELELFVRVNRLSKYVRFLGVVPNKDVCEIMSMADIYLIASDFEGTSVSLLEAMYNSKAIIASNVPGLKDMISHRKSGLLYDVSSPTDLKHNILYMLEDSDAAKRLGAEAHRLYEEKYSFGDIIKFYTNLFL